MYKRIWRGRKFYQGSGFKETNVLYDYEKDEVLTIDSELGMLNNDMGLLNACGVGNLYPNIIAEAKLYNNVDTDTFFAKLAVVGNFVFLDDIGTKMNSIELCRNGAVTTYVGRCGDSCAVILESCLNIPNNDVGYVPCSYVYDTFNWCKGYRLIITVNICPEFMYLLVKSLNFRNLVLSNMRFCISLDNLNKDILLISSLDGVRQK